MGMGDREKGIWKELESDHSRAVKPGHGDVIRFGF